MADSIHTYEEGRQEVAIEPRLIRRSGGEHQPETDQRNSASKRRPHEADPC
jgi:hypothetical protein